MSIFSNNRSKLNRQDIIVANDYFPIDFTSSNVGIKGELYPQEKDFVDIHFNAIIGDYDGDTEEHEYGQLTVDLVISALKNLPGFSVIQTPMNSAADIGLKWDLLLEINSLIYPIQVKSDETFALNAYNGRITDYMHERTEIEFEKYHNNIDKVMNNNYTDRTYKREQKEKLKQKFNKIKEQYRASIPLYIWSSHEPKNISKIIDKFADALKLKIDLKSIKDKSILEYQAKKKIFDDKIKSLKEDKYRETINRTMKRRTRRTDQEAEQTFEETLESLMSGDNL